MASLIRQYPLRIVYVLALGLLLITGLPGGEIFSPSAPRSADFQIKTSDGRSGSINLERVDMRWEADKDAARILGTSGGHWSNRWSGSALWLGAGNADSGFASLDGCDWDSLGENDHGVMTIDAEAQASPAGSPKTATKLVWTCTFAN